MTEPIDWSLTTWGGNRLAHHRAFLALPFREKLLVIEQFEEVAEALARSRAVREKPGEESDATG